MNIYIAKWSHKVEEKNIKLSQSLLLVEEVVVHLDLWVGFEVIRHKHNRNLDVTEFIYLEENNREKIIQ